MSRTAPHVTNADDEELELAPVSEPRLRLSKRLRTRPPIGLTLSIAVLVGLILLALLAPILGLADPNAQDSSTVMAGPSWNHLLGTDYYGRDVLSRLIWGGRSSFEGVGIALGVSLVLGLPWGLAAGYWPRSAGSVLMRLADTLLAFPPLVLAVVITGVLGPGLTTSMMSVGIVFAPVLARLTRIGVLEIRQREYVDSARLSGVPTRIILTRHILPGAMGPVIVQTTIFAGLAFIVEAGLSFLGLGIQPPAPSWGGDLQLAYQYILDKPAMVFPPGIIIAIVVLSVYRIGDSIRNLQSSGLSVSQEIQVVEA
jgi:peptide/nickel transport system permease protein